PQVKCKDCGAFGHTARSLRCPMKRWQGALVPLPLGSRFGKENLAWKLQDPLTPGTPNMAEREEEERQMCVAGRRVGNTHNFAPDGPQSHRDGNWSDRDRSHVLRGHTRGLTLGPEVTKERKDVGGVVCTKAEGFRSCVTPKVGKGLGHSTVGPNCDKDTGFLTLDMFVLQERGAAEEAPAVISQEALRSAATELEAGAGARPLPEDHPRGSPTRRDDVKSSLSTVPLIGRNLAPASKGCIEAPGKRCAQTPTLTCVNPPKKPRLSPVQIPQQSTLTANPGAFLNHPPPPSTAGRGRRVAVRVSRETPAQGQRFDLKLPADRSPSRSVRAFSAAHPSPIIVIPAQPLRMLFLRDGEGCWSCGYTVPPSPWPVERRSVDQEPEVHAIPGPRSILYDDLQVSSSSEESNWD
ncbi:hypothetical protein M91_08020, partial [Bos mutus]